MHNSRAPLDGVCTFLQRASKFSLGRNDLLINLLAIRRDDVSKDISPIDVDACIDTLNGLTDGNANHRRIASVCDVAHDPQQCCIRVSEF